MTVQILHSRRVICRSVLEFPLSTGAVWGQMRDFRSAATHDPFHAAIHIEGGVPRAGAGLLIEHRYLLARVMRVGRILKWDERSGFAFSDLSQRDPTRAFPHVLSYRLEPTGENACRLHIRVTGRWTLPGPRWVGRLWLAWVFGHVVRSTENTVMHYMLAMKNRPC